MKKTILTLIAGAFLIPLSVLAHPGNTDSVGCHTCRTNCSKWGLSQGEYHCHRSKGVEQPKAPVKSSATGVTVPAPEYKTPAAKTVKTATGTSEVKTPPVETAKAIPSPQKSWLGSFFNKVF